MLRNVETLKMLDRYVGTGLCFILQYADRFLRFMRKAVPQRNANGLVFVKLSEMGATVLADHAIRTIMRDCGAERSTWFITFAENTELLVLLKLSAPDHVLTIRRNSFLFLFFDVVRAIKRCRAEKVSVAVDLDLFTRFSAVLAFLSGATRRVGFHRYAYEGLYVGDLYTHTVPYNPYVHIALQYALLGESLREGGVGYFPRRIAELPAQLLPTITLSSDARDSVKQFLAGKHIDEDAQIILFHIDGGELPLRAWPVESYVAVAQELLKTEGRYIISVGVATARRASEQFVAQVGSERCVDAAGIFGLESLFALFERSCYLLCSDSGIAHFATLTSINQSVLFGPETPLLFGPLKKQVRVFYRGLLCSPCFSVLNNRSSVCADNICLKSIGSAEVLATIEEHLRRKEND